MTSKRCELLSLILPLSLIGVSGSLWGQIAAPGTPLGSSAFFTTTDGVKLHYLDAGRGRPIVFIPGWTMPGDIWEPQVREFSRDYRTIALDNRSSGLSEIAAISSEGHSFPRLAADIRDLVEHLGLSDVVLVGWAMGVGQVLNYIERFGTERVGAVVLVDGYVWRPTHPEQCASWIAAAQRMESDRRGSMEGALRAYFAHPHPKEYLRRVVEAHLRTPTRVAAWLGTVSYCSPESDSRGALSKISDADRPLHYVISSPVLLPQGDTLKNYVRRARVEFLDGVGHALPFDAPDRFNRVLREFLRRS
jgi:non-heme chloroperoxidase